MAFFVAFAYGLYPNHQALHPSGWAEGMAASLPLGLGGLVGMIRNWTFTAFFCMSELWGDVCLGLLFWGLANDTTSLADAPTLYPLFGLGANVAQALAGFVLKVGRWAGGSWGGSRVGWITKVRIPLPGGELEFRVGPTATLTSTDPHGPARTRTDPHVGARRGRLTAEGGAGV
jgi:hypothetical protein